MHADLLLLNGRILTMSRRPAADIVVLSQDITRLRSRALLDVEVDLVIVGGRLRYRRAG